LIDFDRYIIEYGLKHRPGVCFLFAENDFIVESDLEAADVGKKDVFFCQ